MMIQLRREPEPEDLPAACWLEQWLEIDTLRDAVAALPDPMRFVIVEHYWGGRSSRSLANELQVGESRVAELLVLGREWLRCEFIARDIVESASVFPTPALR